MKKSRIFLSFLLIMLLSIVWFSPAAFAQGGQTTGKIDNVLIQIDNDLIVSVKIGEYGRAYLNKQGKTFDFLRGNRTRMVVYGIGSGTKYITIGDYGRSYLNNKDNMRTALEVAKAIPTETVQTFKVLTGWDEDTPILESIIINPPEDPIDPEDPVDPSIPTDIGTLKNHLYQNLLDYKTEFTIHYKGDTKEIGSDLNKLLDNILNEGSYLSGTISTLRYKTAGTVNDINITFTVAYHTNAAQEAFVDAEVERIYNKIIQPGMNDFQKIKAINDYIVLHTSYTENTTASPHSAYALFKEGGGVCQAYALATMKLVQKAGYETIYVTGQAKGIEHAWVLVKLDGKWYHLDTTWNDPTPDRPKYVNYNYFLVTDDQLEQDHMWERTNYPKAESSDYLFIHDSKDAITVGEELFYINYINQVDFSLYKLNFITRQKHKLTEDNVQFITPYEDWIFYSNYSDGARIYKVKKNGLDNTKINEEESKNLSIDGTDLVYTSKDGTEKRINLAEPQLPKEPIIEEDTAIVTTSAEFSYAVALPDIKTIEITEGFTVEDNPQVAQHIIIPKGTNNITMDFNNIQIPSLHIDGDNNTIKQVIVDNLIIGETVENAILVDVQDTVGSNHEFAGGGAESIKLLGNTTFKGEIRITSGTDIQIRAESLDAKIQGDLWVESGVVTKISAPVTKVIVNTENSNVIINEKIDQLVVRTNATITVNKEVETPMIEVPIGVKVTAKDETGQVVPVEIKQILDTHGLKRQLEIAYNRYTNTKIGNKNGQVSAEVKEQLVQAIDQAKNILAAHTTVDEATQEIINQATIALQDAIRQFISSIISVDRYQLEQEIRMARELEKTIQIGTGPGEYSIKIYEELQRRIEEAEQWHRKFEVSQKELDDQYESLKNYINNTFKVEQGNVIFEIKGDSEQRWHTRYTRVNIYKKRSYGDEYWYDYQPRVNHTIQELEDGFRISIDYREISEFEEAYIGILAGSNQGEYLFIEKITANDLQQGIIRQIFAEEDSHSLEVQIPHEVTANDHTLGLTLKDENQVRIFDMGIQNGTKIPSGRYNIQYNATTDTDVYALFQEDLNIQEDTIFVFKEEDVVLVDFELEFQQPVNYELSNIMAFLEGYYTFWHPQFLKDKQSIYLSKGIYRELGPLMVVEKNQEFREIYLDTGKVDVQEDTTIRANDDFRIHIIWHDEEPVVDMDTQLYYYIQTYGLMNTLDQRIRWIDRLELDGESGEYHRLGRMWDGTLTLTAGDKVYTKEVDIFDPGHLSIRDIVGDDIITGEVTLEFSMDNMMDVIQPYSKVIIIQNSRNSVIEQILALPEIDKLTLDYAKAAEEARLAYENLSEAEKIAIPYELIQKLEASEAINAALIAVEKAEQEKTSLNANKAWDALVGLPDSEEIRALKERVLIIKAEIDAIGEKENLIQDPTEQFINESMDQPINEFIDELVEDSTKEIEN